MLKFRLRVNCQRPSLLMKIARDFSSSGKLRLPAIISDIDGVIQRGGKRIQGSSEVI